MKNDRKWSPNGAQLEPKIVPKSIPRSIDRRIQFLTSSACHSGTTLEHKMAFQTALIRNHLGLNTEATRDRAFFKTLRFLRGKQCFAQTNDVEV